MPQIISYSLIMILVVALYEYKKSQTDDHFLVANRTVQGAVGAMSIAASWIWAPALFVSTEVGYTWGYSGLFWFTVPNVLALVLFAPFAAKVRQRLPQGYSYIQYIQKDGTLFKNTQLCIQLSVQVVAFAIQVTAGAELVALVAGTNYTFTVIIMTLAPLTYSLTSGLSSSVFTDAIQYLLIAIAIIIIFLGFPAWSEVPSYHFEFSPFNHQMLVQFGLTSGLALLFGIFADHQQWQRAFAIQKEEVRSIYIRAGLLHGIITFSLGTLGVVIASIGFETTCSQLVGALYIHRNMPPVFSIIFTLMALCGLCSTLDSCFCAFGGLVSTELSFAKHKKPFARKAMIMLAILGLALGLYRVPVVTLWLMAGVLRLTSVTPTLLSVFDKQFSGRVGCGAIFSGLLLGTPIFFYGNLQGNSELKTIGMLVCLGVSTSVCLLGRYLSIKRT